MPPRRRAAAELGIDYRPVDEGDHAFLAEVYVEGRLEELEATEWPLDTKRAFLQQQHRLRDGQYRARFPQLEALVILRDGASIGHLALADGENALRLVDIAICADERGRGIGAAIVSDLIDEARDSGKAIELSVEASNPARRLYERAGFRVIREEVAYVAMAWADHRRSDQ